MTQFSLQNWLQRFVSALSNWFNTNKLAAHESNTKLMLFTQRIHPVLPDINFNQNTLEWLSHIKYLGIVFDDKLSFKLHIADVSCGLNRIRGVTYSVSSFLNRESLMTLYYTLVYSHLNLPIVIWGGASENNIKHVRFVVNKILRINLHVKQDDHNITEIGTLELYRTGRSPSVKRR